MNFLLNKSSDDVLHIKRFTYFFYVKSLTFRMYPDFQATLYAR